MNTIIAHYSDLGIGEALADQRFINDLVRPDDQVLASGPIWPEDIKDLLANPLDPGCEGKAQQMRHPEDSFSVSVAVGGMNVAFDDVIAHEPVDHERALPVGGADH